MHRIPASKYKFSMIQLAVIMWMQAVTYRQSLNKHVELILELLVLFIQLFCGYRERRELVCKYQEAEGRSAHTLILLVFLLAVCEGLAILVFGNVFGFSILHGLTLALVGSGGLVVLRHDGGRSG